MPDLFASQNPRSARNGSLPIRRIEQTERERQLREEERIAFVCGGPTGTVTGEILTVVTVTLITATVVSALV